MDEKTMLTSINNVEEQNVEEQDNWYACGTDDYCDLCVGICKPQYH